MGRHRPTFLIALCTLSSCAPADPPPDPADPLLTVAESLYARGEYDSVRLALGGNAGRDSAALARRLTLSSLANWRLGDYHAARSQGERALALKLRHDMKPELFRSYNGLGLLAWNEGRLADALSLFERAHASALASGSAPDRAKSANNVGLVLVDLAEFERARAGFESARAAAREIGDPLIEGRALSNIAMLDIQGGDAAAAIPALAEARRLFAVAGDRTGEQHALGQLATALHVLNRAGAALAALDTALQLARAQGLQQEEASNLELIADIYRTAGDYRRALAFYDQANRLNVAVGLPIERGANLRRAAELYAVLGQYDRASANARAALALHRETEARREQLRDLLTLAEISSLSEGEAAPAQGFLRSAEQIAQALDSRGARVELAITQARVAERSKDAPEVLQVLRNARADLNSGDFHDEWQAAAMAAQAFLALGQLDSALAAASAAVDGVEQVRSSLASGQLRTTIMADRSAAYEQLIDINLRIGRVERAFEVADRARNQTLVEHTGAAKPGNDQSLLLRRIRSLVTRADALESVPPEERSPEVSSRLAALNAELTRARSAYETWRIENAERAGSRAPGAAINGAEIRRTLRPGEGVIEYVVTPDRLITFVVTRDDVRHVASDVSRTDLARRVRLARDLLGAGGDAASEAPVLRRLHALLIAPAESAGILNGLNRLVMVPQSFLAHVPFAALENTAGITLVRRYTLSELPTASALPVLRGRTADRGSAPSRTVAFAPFVKALPGSLVEARAVRRITGGTEVQSRHATEARVRGALRRASVVHLATHAVMDPHNPMFSRIELTRGGDRAHDDGRLEVHELLDLRVGAGLVYLSGCETALGAYGSTAFLYGEDYATMAHGFMVAGANAVIATLWKIDDEGAARFAERFYRHLRTLPPAEALAAAQRESLAGAASGRHYWAAYKLMGS